MPVYTIREYGQTFTFEARDVEQLTERLYRRTSWTRRECRRIAVELLAGRVVSAPHHETIILPGRFDVLEDRPVDRASWTPS